MKGDFMSRRSFRILAVIFLIGSLVGAPLLFGQDMGKERVSQVQRSLVKLINLAPDGSDVLRGNGFLISPDGLLLTNFHLIDRASRLQVYVPGGDVYDRGIVKALDPEADLALLKIPAFNAPFVELAKSDVPTAGNSVFIVPQAKPDAESVLRKAKVVAHHRLPSGATVISVDQQWDTETKGGPVFNMAGECIGITTLGYEADRGPGVFIDANRVSGLLTQKIEALMDAVSWDLFEPKKDEAVRDSLRAVGLGRRFPVAAIRAEKDLSRRLELASEFDPTDLPTRTLLARAYLQARQFENASKQISLILAREPSSLPVLTLKGDLAYHQGDFDSARSTYQEVVAKGFQSPHFYNADLKGVRLPDFYHDHAIAGCSGPLILSNEKLTYLPNAWSNDRWTAPYAAIQRVQVKSSMQAGRPVHEFNFKFSGSVSNQEKTWAKGDFQLRISAKETKDALIGYLQKHGVEVLLNEKR
jgi:tetratricopeptide (TPR) repeat protein